MEGGKKGGGRAKERYNERIDGFPRFKFESREEGREGVPGARVCALLKQSVYNWIYTHAHVLLGIDAIACRLKDKSARGGTLMAQDRVEELRVQALGGKGTDGILPKWDKSFSFPDLLLTLGAHPENASAIVKTFMVSDTQRDAEKRMNLALYTSSDIPSLFLDELDADSLLYITQVTEWMAHSRTVLALPTRVFDFLTSFDEYELTTWQNILATFPASTLALEFATPMRIGTKVGEHFSVKYIEGCLVTIIDGETEPVLHVHPFVSDSNRERFEIVKNRDLYSRARKGDSKATTTLQNTVFNGYADMPPLFQVNPFDIPISSPIDDAENLEEWQRVLAKAVAGACIFVSEASKSKEKGEQKTEQETVEETEKETDTDADATAEGNQHTTAQGTTAIEPNQKALEEIVITKVADLFKPGKITYIRDTTPHAPGAQRTSSGKPRRPPRAYTVGPFTRAPNGRAGDPTLTKAERIPVKGHDRAQGKLVAYLKKHGFTLEDIPPEGAVPPVHTKVLRS